MGGAYHDDTGFVDLRERLRVGHRGPLPVIKIHGCVSEHLSMIDTLKQRKRGRARHLEECLDALQSGYWLYLGFSADDLESNHNYLGLRAGAVRSAGATYVAYPGNPNLGNGAQLLMDAFGDRRSVVIADIVTHLEEVCKILENPGPASIPADNALGLSRFQAKLKTWADTLPPAAAGLCLAAMLEAIGQAEPRYAYWTDWFARNCTVIAIQRIFAHCSSTMGVWGQRGAASLQCLT